MRCPSWAHTVFVPVAPLLAVLCVPGKIIFFSSFEEEELFFSQEEWEMSLRSSVEAKEFFLEGKNEKSFKEK